MSERFQGRLLLLARIENLQSQLEACRKERDEFKELNGRLAEQYRVARENTDEALEALEFYADKKNWHKDHVPGNELSNYLVMSYSDAEEINQSTLVGGKLARQTISKIQK